VDFLLSKTAANKFTRLLTILHFQQFPFNKGRSTQFKVFTTVLRQRQYDLARYNWVNQLHNPTLKHRGTEVSTVSIPRANIIRTLHVNWRLKGFFSSQFYAFLKGDLLL
jgi:hypothetical protein